MFQSVNTTFLVFFVYNVLLSYSDNGTGGFFVAVGNSYDD